MRDVDRALSSHKLLVVLLYQEVREATNDLTHALPLEIVSVLNDFTDVLPEDVPAVLPPIQGIEHQIDLMPGATIPNRPSYRANPEETKELQKQVGELLEKVSSVCPLALVLFQLSWFQKKMALGVCALMVGLLIKLQSSIVIQFQD